MSISKFWKEAIAWRVGGGHLADHQAMGLYTSARSIVFAEIFPGANDQAKWQAAINYLAAGSGGTVTTKNATIAFNTILVTTDNITLDFNNASLTVNPNAAGQAAIYFQGSFGTDYAITYTNLGETRVQLATVSDVNNFSVGDWVEVADNAGTNAWNYGQTANTPYTGVSYGYTYHAELARVETVDTINGILYLSKALDNAYTYQMTVHKVNFVKGAKVLNIKSIHEADPGSMWPGDIGATNAPHLIKFDRCYAPEVKNVYGNGWRLHLVNAIHCAYGTITEVYGDNPYYTTIGGHGYLVRIDRCFRVHAFKTESNKVRHSIDFVMSYDCITEKNTANNPINQPFSAHGMAVKRWTSIDDAVYCTYGQYCVGFGVGNPAFSGDSDCTFIRPVMRGGSVGILIGYQSTNIRVIDPDLQTENVAIQIIEGSSYVYIQNGKLSGTTTKNLNYLIYAAAKEQYNTTDTFSLPVSNIYVNGTSLNCAALQLNAGTYGNAAVYIDAGGEVEVTNVTTKNATGTTMRNAIVIGETQAATNIYIDNNFLIPATLTNGVKIVTAASNYQRVSGNRIPTTTGTSVALPITTTTDVIDNLCAVAPAFSGSVATSIAGGAVLRGNTPAASYNFVNSQDIAGLAATSRQLTFSTAAENGTTSNRWVMRCDGTAESGSNFGSNLSIIRRSDTGALIDTPFFINRNNGSITVNGTWQSPFLLGTYYLWVEVATGKLRIKATTAPTSDADGGIVGQQ